MKKADVRHFLESIPVLGRVIVPIHRRWLKLRFPGSRAYWENRYANGGHSGLGSRRMLAQHKADIINTFVKQNHIDTVIEYGCGDGFQLQLADYPSYIGFDVSRHAITRCRQIFAGDADKSFALIDAYNGQRATLTLSLDVLYHLVEDEVFEQYMHRLFDSSLRYVIIYSSDAALQPDPLGLHVRHRKFSSWVANNKHDWRLITHIPNRYPYQGNPENGSFSDFYIYGK